MFIIFLCLSFFLSINCLNGAVDLVIFSYNRPLQLYALLESLEKYCSGLGKQSVLYRAGSSDYAAAYEEVKNRFNNIEFIEQSHQNAPGVFKPLTMQVCKSGESKYIAFAVDDIIVKDYFDFEYCSGLLQNTNSYAFFLRLGKNITKSYPDIDQEIPSLQLVENDVYCWNFSEGEINWAYIFNLDMTIYRKEDVLPLIASTAFTAPNPFEGELCRFNAAMANKQGLCFAESKIVNIPMNQVQTCCPIPNMHINPSDLLNNFKRGLKINIADLHQIDNCAPHMDFYPTFIMR